MENIKILADFNSKIDFLSQKADDLTNIIKSFFPEDKNILLIDENIDKLNKNIFRIIVVGEFKRGKSTFINALLGKKILPVGITPTTASVNVIKYSEHPKAILKYKDKTEKEITLEELNYFATVKNTDFDKLNLIEVYYDAELCKEKVEIIDSPGVNDIDEQRVEITYDFIPKCDAAIFLLSATQQLSSSERDFITNKINKYLDKVFFVLNKVDQLNDTEREEALNYVNSEISNVSTTNKIFPLSSKLALKAITDNSLEDLEKSGIKNFQEELFNFLLQEKGSVLLKNSCSKLINSSNKASNNLNLLLSALEQSMEEFLKSVELSKIEFEVINQEKELINNFIDEKKTKVINNIIEDLNFSFAAFLPKIDLKMKELINEDPESLKKSISSYIKVLIDDWANKTEVFIKSEIDSLDEYIQEKTKKIYQNLQNIHNSFISSNQVAIEFKTNSDENIFIKNIPEFLLDQSNYTSKIARGTIFTIGAAVLMGGAIIPALLLGGVATFLSDIFLKSWKEDKVHTQMFSAIKDSLEKSLPLFKEQTQANLDSFFESNIRKPLIDELDSSIQSLQNTIDLLVIKKSTKEIEVSRYKREYQDALNKLNQLEKDIAEII